MKYIELSKESLNNTLKPLWRKAEREFTPEAILFVAKGGFYAGLAASQFFNAPLFEIHALREKGLFKKKLSPILRLIPKNIKKILRSLEIASQIHKKSPERNISFNDNKLYEYKKILLVDDSVDTGSTIISINNYFNDKNLFIRTAAINIMSLSKESKTADYYLFEDTLISGPWSEDSKEKTIFDNDYAEWKKSRG